VELDLHDFCFGSPASPNSNLSCDFPLLKKRLLEDTHENTMQECKNTTTEIPDDNDIDNI
jgi:hypothetical protein